MASEKKEVAGKRNELLSRIILTKLKTIRKEKFGPKSIDKFSLTIRVFLLRYLNLNYEFTLDELVDELNKRKISKKLSKRIVAILDLITKVVYENKKISKEEFISLLEEAEGVINLATGKAEKKSEKEEKIEIKKGPLFSFLHKFGAVKTKEEKESIKRIKETKEKKIVEEEKKRLEEEKKKELERKKELKQREKFSKQNGEDKNKLEEIMRQRKLEKAKTLEPVPGVEGKTDKIELIKKKIDGAKAMMHELNLDGAKRTYTEIIKIYISLEPREQAGVYKDIMDLYYERKNKEKVNRVE